ncbi:hypothetical protein K402DRAFT_357926 [Aulographum hederae CBS 113979]|uniref:Uncharacterized protein n=1 Tax=Aulographum hederae CBS 113979 TaxID=1176131 RepID=A0A6G1GWI9_9PEZI|nr:hypothetical protein K402DRAFT_357926 [Aulographum hederae CBS 113979]
MPPLSLLVYVAQTVFAGNASYKSYIAISNLIQYEERTKQAAQYSDTAAIELRKTRTTQGAGVVAELSTIISAIYLFTTTSSEKTKLSLSAANVLLCLAVRAHVAGHWKDRAKVPLVKGFNDAITASNELIDHLAILAGSWIVAFGLGVFHF